MVEKTLDKIKKDYKFNYEKYGASDAMNTLIDDIAKYHEAKKNG